MPDLICNPNNVPGGRTRFEWWNPSCVVNAQFGTYGNANMAAFTLPGLAGIVAGTGRDSVPRDGRLGSTGSELRRW